MLKEYQFVHIYCCKTFEHCNHYRYLFKLAVCDLASQVQFLPFVILDRSQVMVRDIIYTFLYCLYTILRARFSSFRWPSRTGAESWFANIIYTFLYCLYVILRARFSSFCSLSRTGAESWVMTLYIPFCTVCM